MLYFWEAAITLEYYSVKFSLSAYEMKDWGIEK